MNSFADSRIISVTKENDWVSSFVMDPVPQTFNSRKAGQFLLLKLPAETGMSPAHPFTITCAPKEARLRISVKRVGPFTTALHGICAPQDVQISGPMGVYGKEIDNPNSLVFIAGGIGITPFICLLSHLAETGSKADVTLIWANNRMEEFFFLDFLKALSGHINLKVVLVASDLQGTEAAGLAPLAVRQGSLNTETLSPLIPADPDTAFYMCGSEGMQNFVFSQLEPLGIARQRVTVEKIGMYMKDGETAPS